MDKLKEFYEKLYTDYVNSRCRVKLENCCHFTGMKGSKYDSNEIKFAIIGRATNGWIGFDCNSKEKFAQNAFDEFYNKIGFDWVKNDGDKLTNGGDYSLNSSRFWTSSRDIYYRLTKEAKEVRWIDNIAWTNLYKIARAGDNPTEAMCYAQLEACKDILNEELNIYSPTHILLVVDTPWFNDFSDLFSDYLLIENEDFVVGTAKFKNAKVVITSRPEYKSQQDFVENVLSFF